MTKGENALLMYDGTTRGWASEEGAQSPCSSETAQFPSTDITGGGGPGVATDS